MNKLYTTLTIILCMVFIAGIAVMIYDPSRVNTLTVATLIVDLAAIVRLGYLSKTNAEG